APSAGAVSPLRPTQATVPSRRTPKAAPEASVMAWAATAIVPSKTSGSCVPTAICSRSRVRINSASVIFGALSSTGSGLNSTAVGAGNGSGSLTPGHGDILEGEAIFFTQNRVYIRQQKPLWTGEVRRPQSLH